MLITKLEESTKGRTKVYLDYEFYFVLYPRELKQFTIRLDEEIDEEIVQKIEEEIILPRGKNKAIYILKHMDRTSSELSQKLKQAFYNDRIIDKVLEYVKEYRYIDDERFAHQYVRNKIQYKSKRQVEQELRKKGMNSDLILAGFDECESSEEDGLRHLVEKRLKGKTDFTREELMKHYAYFARRGYEISMIKSIIKEYEQN